MQRTDAQPEPAGRSRHRWATARRLLGLAQILGATLTLGFMVQTGESALTFSSAGITASFTLTSLVLFKGRYGQCVPSPEH